MSRTLTPGLVDASKRLGRTLVSILETRLALLATDFADAWTRLLSLLVTAALALLCFGLAIILAAFFVVAIFWESHRLLALGGLSVVFTLAGGLLWMSVARAARTAPQLFSATREELLKDRAHLSMHRDAV